MSHKAIYSAIIVVICLTLSINAEINTNNIEWASTESVLVYLDELVSEFGTAKKVPREYLGHIKVSVNDLWQKGLEFEIQTNDYGNAATLISHREEELRLIARFPSFSAYGTNRVLVASFLERMRKVKNAPRDKPLPPPVIFKPIEAKPDDPLERIEEIRRHNEIIASNNAARIMAYENDQVKRHFYRKLDSFYSFLDSFIPISLSR